MRRWVREGCPHERGKLADGQERLLFDLAAVRGWLSDKNRVPGKRGRPSDTAGASESAVDRLAEAKIRKELAHAERAELDVAERKGLLVPRAEYEAAEVQRILAAKAAFLGLPARETPMLVGRDAREIQTILDAAVRRILEGLATPPAS